MSPLRSAKLVFWDFDGVIKCSVGIKADAFEQLFRPFGVALSQRVRAHHLAHGGLSRFEKIPLYLQWAGVEATPEKITEYCQRFTELACQAVIDAPWVEGVQQLLRENPFAQTFVLMTATPQTEIEQILAALRLDDCFERVYGAPTSKMAVIRDTLANNRVPVAQCLVIGDAAADWQAAHANGVPFLLLRHDSNESVFHDYRGDSIEDFTSV